MLQALATRHDRTVAGIFLAIAGALAIAAAVVGIDDNPPGILLALLSAVAVVLVVVHPWRSARKFLFLFLGALLSLVVLAVLHNVFEGVAGASATGPFPDLLRVLGVVAFLLALLVCPPAALVGGVGSLIMLIRDRRRRPTRNPIDAPRSSS